MIAMDVKGLDLSKTWLIGLSCGPDSMALLYQCLEAGVSVACAFVNYHHRMQANEEEAYARSVCSKLGLPLHVLNDPFVCDGENFEAKAREWRYDFFVRLVQEYGYGGVIVGHHQDDVLETYLMQKEKGIVPMVYGLAQSGLYHGMVVKRVLLDQTKEELESYCKKNGIQYYIDHTNFDEGYTRNRIRHQVLGNMSYDERMALLEEIRIENEELERLREMSKRYVYDGRVDVGLYRSLDKEVRLFVLRELLEDDFCKKRMSLKHVMEIDDIVCKKKDFELECFDRRLGLLDGYIVVLEKSVAYAYEISCLGDVWDVQSSYFEVFQGGPSVYAVSVSEDDFPLTIRSYQEGDFIQMRFGKKKLTRFFIDKHIPLCMRKTYPVVVNRKGEVILVPFIGCDVSHYSISPTFSVLQCFQSVRREKYDMGINTCIQEVLISEEAIQQRVAELGAKITEDYKDCKEPLMVVALLKGSVPFLADLTRKLDLEFVYDFMDVSSYAGTQSTGNVKVLKDLSGDVTGCNVLIVEDIVDTGNTLKAVKDLLKNRGANDVKIATFLNKQERRVIDIQADYVGYEIPDRFVVGYGMDFNERFRSLPYVGVYKGEE